MADEWRLIDSGPCDAFFNMALDEAIAAEVRERSFPPTLRLYGWERPSLSLGCFQKTADINRAYCEDQHIPVVRRPTGGRAILHGAELTYSLSARTDRGAFCSGLLDSYRKISMAFSLAFQHIGISAEARTEREKGSVLGRSPLCFHSSSFGELLVAKKKLVGSAQKRWQDGLLQQGSIPYRWPEEKLEGIFGAAITSGLRDSMNTLRELHPLFDDEEFRKTVVSAFEEAFGIRFLRSVPSREESLRAEQLLHQKYLQRHWNFRQ